MRDAPHARITAREDTVKNPVLLATLGFEPQVITIAAQLLRQQGVSIRRVIVAHTSSRAPAIGQALLDLQTAFAAPPLQELTLELYPLMRDRLPLIDVTSQEEAQATFGALYRLVKGLKQQGCQIHCSIAGGRKIMSLYGLAVAQLLFDEQDALYYLLSEDALLRERRLLLGPNDHAQLIPIPFLRWTSDAALMADILRYDDPLLAMGRGTQLAEQRERQRWQTFCRHVLSPAEEAAVALVVREGLTNRQIAQRLGRSHKTVANQLSNVYAKLGEYIESDGGHDVDRHSLITLLHAHYHRNQ